MFFCIGAWRFLELSPNHQAGLVAVHRCDTSLVLSSSGSLAMEGRWFQFLLRALYPPNIWRAHRSGGKRAHYENDPLLGDSLFQVFGHMVKFAACISCSCSFCGFGLGTCNLASTTLHTSNSAGPHPDHPPTLLRLCHLRTSS